MSLKLFLTNLFGVCQSSVEGTSRIVFRWSWDKRQEHVFKKDHSVLGFCHTSVLYKERF